MLKANQLTSIIDKEYQQPSPKKVLHQEDNYNFILSIQYLFYGFDGFFEDRCSGEKREKLFNFWPKCQDLIKKRVDIINNCLDMYDLIFPIDYVKPILNNDEIKDVKNILKIMIGDTRYRVMNEVGVDLNLELGCPGWIDLKRLILRFLSKIKIQKNDKILEGDSLIEEVRQEDKRIFVTFEKD